MDNTQSPEELIVIKYDENVIIVKLLLPHQQKKRRLKETSAEQTLDSK